MSCTVRRSPEHVPETCAARLGMPGPWRLFATVCIHVSFYTCAGMLVCLVSPVDGKPEPRANGHSGKVTSGLAQHIWDSWSCSRSPPACCPHRGGRTDQRRGGSECQGPGGLPVA